MVIEAGFGASPSACGACGLLCCTCYALRSTLEFPYCFFALMRGFTQPSAPSSHFLSVSEKSLIEVSHSTTSKMRGSWAGLQAWGQIVLHQGLLSPGRHRMPVGSPMPRRPSPYPSSPWSPQHPWAPSVVFPNTPLCPQLPASSPKGITPNSWNKLVSLFLECSYLRKWRRNFLTMEFQMSFFFFSFPFWTWEVLPKQSP